MIRRYGLNDIEPMLTILETDLKDTIYRDMKFSHTKLGDTLRGNVGNTQFFGNLAVEEEKIIGGLVATVVAPMFSYEVIAYDHFFYVVPDKRSLGVATALVAGYIEWAKERKVRRVVLSNSMRRNVDTFARLATRLGFEQDGTIHSMEI